jgi:hypothetical protein
MLLEALKRIKHGMRGMKPVTVAHVSASKLQQARLKMEASRTQRMRHSLDTFVADERSAGFSRPCEALQALELSR